MIPSRLIIALTALMFTCSMGLAQDPAADSAAATALRPENDTTSPFSGPVAPRVWALARPAALALRTGPALFWSSFAWRPA